MSDHIDDFDDYYEDHCYECTGYGDDYYFDEESGEWVCACDECCFNESGDEDE